MTYTLTGRYPTGDLEGRAGRLRFTPSTTIVGAGNIILPAPVEVDLDSDGAFTVALVGTDDADYAPSGWVWTVAELLQGGRPAWSFELTADGDISDLTAVAVPDSYSAYVVVGDELTASLSSGAATAGQVPAADGAGGIDWADQSGGGADLSDALPADLGTAAAGVGTSASRDDHVHDLPTAADVGAAATSHTHALTDVTDAGGAAALDVGTTAGTVAAGDDSRIVGSVTAIDLLEAGGAAVSTVAATGATETLVATHAAHKVTMDEDCEFTFPTPSVAGWSFVLLLAGAFTPTWPASVDWAGGSAPGYTSPSLYVFSTLDTGTTWLGAQVGAGYA